ncbi:MULTISPECIES: hypothetical protein [Paenibacillus]|uniref:hypothetical protein n=1 Tax=Paenibacillus TaxID=44249 RepID=UPI0007BF6194|nr:MULTISPECIES: hypothetical protein [Paenibacillus]MCZ1265392.1 hypothetical protein [Paenibacillus tundrae]
MTDYQKVKSEVWTQERIAEHLKAIGAEYPPEPPKKGVKSVTAPQQRNGSQKYYKRGGEW